ncbi:cysteine hydrolase family protein [Vagococcus martis]|uniref:cysteine hydrolase family protein n=1 Tax=Vagococcus martis TaxID=1768210 RepID=UPI0009A3BC5E
MKNVNSVVDYFKNNNLPIIYVEQTGVGNLYSKLHFTQSDYVITKSKPSSFSSEEFCNSVNELNPNEFVVTGLMSNACVQATCKSALQKHFKVTLVEDGHDSIIKPFRTIFNKHLKNKGATLVKCSDFVIDK